MIYTGNINFRNSYWTCILQPLQSKTAERIHMQGICAFMIYIIQRKESSSSEPYNETVDIALENDRLEITIELSTVTMESEKAHCTCQTAMVNA